MKWIWVNLSGNFELIWSLNLGFTYGFIFNLRWRKHLSNKSIYYIYIYLNLNYSITLSASIFFICVVVEFELYLWFSFSLNLSYNFPCSTSVSLIEFYFWSVTKLWVAFRVLVFFGIQIQNFDGLWVRVLESLVF